MVKRMEFKCVLGCAVLVLLAVPMVSRANIPLTCETWCMAKSWVYDDNKPMMDGTNYAHDEDCEYDMVSRTDTSSTISCTPTSQGATISVSMWYSYDCDDYGGNMRGRGYCTNVAAIKMSGIVIGTTPSCPEGAPVTLTLDFNDIYDDKYLDDFGVGTEYLGSMYQRTDPSVETVDLQVYAGDYIYIHLFKSLSYASYYGNVKLSAVPAVPEPATALLLLAGIPLIRRR